MSDLGESHVAVSQLDQCVACGLLTLAWRIETRTWYPKGAQLCCLRPCALTQLGVRMGCGDTAVGDLTRDGAPKADGREGRIKKEGVSQENEWEFRGFVRKKKVRGSWFRESIRSRPFVLSLGAPWLTDGQLPLPRSSRAPRMARWYPGTSAEPALSAAALQADPCNLAAPPACLRGAISSDSPLGSLLDGSRAPRIAQWLACLNGFQGSFSMLQPAAWALTPSSDYWGPGWTGLA